jgi:hypothetical protein
MIGRDDLGVIAEVVRRETRYLRHYMGQVLSNEDELGRGRVLCSVPELGLDTQDKAPWCWPRYRHSQSTPKVGEWVEVYFMGGDPDRPVYLGGLGELKDQVPPSYSGPRVHVLFEHPEGEMAIRHESGQLKIGAADKSFVLGEDLVTFLNDLASALTLHVHTGVTTGPGSSGPPGSSFSGPSGVLSGKIKGE